MKDFKQIIAEEIEKATNINKEKILENIGVPKDASNGDYAFPCFILAKELKKSPVAIAEEIKEKISQNLENIKEISEVSAVNGFLNFKLNKNQITQEVIDEFDTEKENFGSQKQEKPQNIVIDYSAPNIAKPFHIGHLRSTVIGQALYNIYKYLGYNVTSINHLGDYGTQFGKLIEGYKRWGAEYDIENNPIDELMQIYVRINNLCKEDESVLEECRNNFKKLEDGDPYCVEIWKKFRELSLKEFDKVYDILGVKFDSLNGEAFYSDKMPEIIDILKKAGKLEESEGAQVVKLGDDMPPCLIIKSNGSTTYATRDLAAIMYRARTYDFDKAIYVTSYEQILHFKQVFATAKYLGLDEKYTNGLVHVPFGMILLKTGKMSTREGKVIKLEDLLNEAIEKSKEIIEKKNPELENKEDVAKKVGVGAIIFNDLSNGRIKDEIFDWDIMLNFNGETGPYVQYTTVRAKSVLEKAGYIPNVKEVNVEKLNDKDSQKIINQLYNFNSILKNVTEKEEPSILARYLVDLAQNFSSFYNNCHIITEDKEMQDARLYITYIVKTILEKGLNLLGIQVPEKM
ncbi:arginine--tRNA ligase [Clostridium sp. CAG:780]|nr:arginine--tRNA ligase [Clostridium sp. CAG:780]